MMNLKFNLTGLIIGLMMWSMGPLAVFGAVQIARLAGWLN